MSLLVNTIYSKTSDVGLQSGYASTTNAAGKTVPTYTGTKKGNNAQSMSSSSSAAGVGPAATAAPFMGAAILAGVAAFIA